MDMSSVYFCISSCIIKSNLIKMSNKNICKEIKFSLGKFLVDFLIVRTLLELR